MPDFSYNIEPILRPVSDISALDTDNISPFLTCTYPDEKSKTFSDYNHFENESTENLSGVPSGKQDTARHPSSDQTRVYEDDFWVGNRWQPQNTHLRFLEEE